MRINENNVYEIINDAEISFNKCFSYLCTLKSMDNKSTSEIVISEFQPLLSDTLYNLMTFYQALNQLERNTIQRKKSYKYNWFTQKMKKIHDYKEAISETIEIGKELGDSFVWIFYENNDAELEKHMLHEETGLFTAGIGGMGEIEFIKNNPMLFGYFVIYHGISSILRIGDFSLYSPEHGIVALGELKSYKEDSNIVVRAFITSRLNLTDEKIKVIKSDNKKPSMNGIANPDRLRKQLKNIQSLLDYRIGDIQKKVHSKSLSRLLDNIDMNKQTFVVNPENNFIVIGLNTPCNSLAKVLLGEPMKITPPNGVSDKFIQISKPSSKYNRIIMIDFSHKVYTGRIPIFWWDTEISIINKLIFRRLFLLTIFNPVSLYEYYVNQGFTIIETKDGDIVFEKLIDSKKITVGNVAHYFNLIANSFLSLEAVTGIIDKTLAEVLKMDVTESTKFQISVMQKDS